jgi:16S rRNA processing protein RimM
LILLPEKRVFIAEIRQAHGIKGEVRLSIYTEDPQSLIKYSPLYTSDGKEVVVEKIRQNKSDWLASLVGVSDRNTAEALQGKKLFCLREQWPSLPEGQWYLTDIVGLKLLDSKSSEIGKITGFVNYGAGDLLEVDLFDKAKVCLVPFSNPIVDLENGTVQVEIAEGLLED